MLLSDALKLEMDVSLVLFCEDLLLREVDVLLEVLFCGDSLSCEKLCSEGTYSESSSLCSSSLSSKN